MISGEYERGKGGYHLLANKALSTHKGRLPRRFSIEFDNSKKRKPNTPQQSYATWGVEFPSKHVIIDTSAIKPDYANMEEMQAEIGRWGKCEVEYIDE